MNRLENVEFVNMCMIYDGEKSSRTKNESSLTGPASLFLAGM